jgi:hypothetical protein
MSCINRYRTVNTILWFLKRKIIDNYKVFITRIGSGMIVHIISIRDTETDQNVLLIIKRNDHMCHV